MTQGVFRVRLDVPTGAADTALAAALATGVQGVEIQDQETGGPPPGRVYIILWHADSADTPNHRRDVAAALRKGAGADAVVSLETADDGWTALLAADLEPALLGSHFAALPPGATPPPDRRPLWVESGGGFGSGMHPTTALCVGLLEPFINAETRVLDVGCGSGVLALAALLMGAQSAVGVDIDSVALAAAARNAAHNGVGDRARWVEKMPPQTADLVLANLYPGPLTQLAPDLSRRIEHGGVLIISGFREPQRKALEGVYRDHGLHVVDAHSRAGWHGLILSSRPEAART